MKMFRSFISVLFLISSLALIGCGINRQNATDTSQAGNEQSLTNNEQQEVIGSHLNISMVTNISGVQDRSFNQSAWEGLQLARNDFGVNVNYLESNQPADYDSNLETLVDLNKDIIFAIGFPLAAAIEHIANNYPEQYFAIIDHAYEEKIPNVTEILFKDHESSYLVGYIAGKMTETNIVGFAGGMNNVVIDRFEYGFRAGVRDANPDAEVLVQYINSFVDQASGKTIATNMYQSGADIIFHAAGDAGIGVIEAAVEQDKYVIGADRDQYEMAPNHVLTSTIKEVGNSMYDIIYQMLVGTYESGSTLVYGLENGGVGISQTSDIHVPKDLLEEIHQSITAKIMLGEIVVPANEEEFNSHLR